MFTVPAKGNNNNNNNAPASAEGQACAQSIEGSIAAPATIKDSVWYNPMMFLQSVSNLLKDSPSCIVIYIHP